MMTIDTAPDSRQSAGKTWLPNWYLPALAALELVFLYSELQAIGLICAAMVVLLPAIAWRSLGVREYYLVGLCILLAALAWWLDKPLAELTLDGLGRSAYLASFILLMALLREGAMTSNSVLAIGRYLTEQPPSRRFIAVFGGGHALAVMNNLGALSLLAPIIQRGVRANLSDGATLDVVAQIRERRQLSAALRGFSWFLVWAPTAVTQAVMPTLMSGIDTLRLVGTGLVLALTMLAVSWAEDWLRWRGIRRRLGLGIKEVTAPPVMPGAAFWRFGAVCALLFGSSFCFMWLANVTIVTGVMLASPLVVAAWVTMQHQNRSEDYKSGASIQQLRKITFEAVPGYVREAVFVACAGFIGTVAAKLVPVAYLANLVGLENIPGWAVLWGLSFSVWLFGQVGLSPITSAIFLASLIVEIPVLPVDMTHAALAIATGTAVCTAGAPFSAGAIMLAKATGYSPTTLTWKWNGTYTLLVMLVLIVFYAVLELI